MSIPAYGKSLRLLMLTLSASVICLPASASDTLPSAAPAEVGISARRLSRVEEVVRDYVEQGRAAGIVTLISRHGRIVHRSAVGAMGIRDARPMQADSLFRIMSMTKAITAVAALILYEEGHFQLYDPVSRYLPAFTDMHIFDGTSLKPATRPITVQQLFTHTAGLSYGYPPGHDVYEFIDKPSADVENATAYANEIAKLPLVSEPGSRWHYSFATDVLGALVEVVSGQPLAEFMRARIFAPLGMTDTGYTVGASALTRLSTAHRWDPSTQTMTELSAPPFEAPYRYTEFDGGGAGLIASAADYMRFLEMLRQGGSLNGERILGPKTVHFMTQDHLPCRLTNANYGENLNPTLGKGGSHGLGIGIYLDPVRRGVLSSPGELEWGGIYGTIYWWDPIEDIIVVSMLQLAGSPWQLRFRDDLSVALYQALEEINSQAADDFASRACRD